MARITKTVATTSTVLVTFIFVVTISILMSPVKADWDDDDDYRPRHKPLDPWLIVFLVVFFGLGSVGACLGCYCRFCGGADRYYGEPVRYVGRGVYIPERLVAHESYGHVNQGVYVHPYDPAVQPYGPTTQPYGQPYPPPPSYGYGQPQYPPENQPHIIHIN